MQLMLMNPNPNPNPNPNLSLNSHENPTTRLSPNTSPIACTPLRTAAEQQTDVQRTTERETNTHSDTNALTGSDTARTSAAGATHVRRRLCDDPPPGEQLPGPQQRQKRSGDSARIALTELMTNARYAHDHSRAKGQTGGGPANSKGTRKSPRRPHSAVVMGMSETMGVEHRRLSASASASASATAGTTAPPPAHPHPPPLRR